MINPKTLSSMIRTVIEAFLFNHPASKNPENWNEKKLFNWFYTGEWRLDWEIFPDESINKKELAIQFFKNIELWETAFNFLNTTDLEKISTGRYELEGEYLYVNVDEYPTKNEEDSNFEAHRIYADIQYLVYGKEKIGISVLEDTKEIIPYDSVKDITFVTTKQNNYRIASPEMFFVFFPEDAHRPCVKANENIKIRKVVVKIRID